MEGNGGETRTVVMVSVLHDECSQSIQATNLVSDDSPAEGNRAVLTIESKGRDESSCWDCAEA